MGWILAVSLLAVVDLHSLLVAGLVSDSRSFIGRIPTTSTVLSLAAAGDIEDVFPFSSEELIVMTREYVENPSPDWWDDDEFVFRGPVIGPLCKTDLVETLMASIDLADAFPDLQANAFGFTADDPIEPHRVWYFVRPRGTFLGDFCMPGSSQPIQATGAPYIAPPECRSVIWNRAGKIRYQSVGYVADRFTGDTTGGRGAVFGQYAVMGQEIDPNPGSFTTRFLQKLSEYLPGVPKSYSRPQDVPDWWKDERRGADL